MDAKRKVFLVLGSAAVIATAAFGGGALFFAGSDTGLASRPVSSQTSTANSAAASSTSPQTQSTGTSYKNGSYSASSSYFVPHGNQNSIKTSLTVSNGTVTAVSVSDDYSDGTSAAFVDWFEQELQNQVVGKSLANLSPSRIGGASLTTEAFDQTLDTIRNDAAA